MTTDPVRRPLDPLPLGATIGILGGGQLGRMLALAAARLGFRVHIYCPEADSPAFDVAASCTIAEYDNQQALARFADSCDVVTYEFENVPAATASFLAARKPVFPDARALEITQDRLTEKSFLRNLGIPVSPFAAISDPQTAEAGFNALGRPAVLKTRRFGYDGKGQIIVEHGDDHQAAFRALGNVPCILEGFISFDREISLIIAHGADGASAAYDPAENRHVNAILHTSTVPAAIRPETAAKASAMARTIVEALDYVGVLAIEMFVVGHGPDQTLMVNELAPRVHNSGHWTEDAAATSQFEQHIRAIAGWPLGAPTRRAEVEMTNLLGDDILEARKHAADPDCHVHVYGKREARPGRKMGHVNRIRDRSGL